MQMQFRDLDASEIAAVSGGMEELVVSGTRRSTPDYFFFMQQIGAGGGGGGSEGGGGGGGSGDLEPAPLPSPRPPVESSPIEPLPPLPPSPPTIFVPPYGILHPDYPFIDYIPPRSNERWV